MIRGQCTTLGMTDANSCRVYTTLCTSSIYRNGLFVSPIIVLQMFEVYPIRVASRSVPTKRVERGIGDLRSLTQSSDEPSLLSATVGLDTCPLFWLNVKMWMAPRLGHQRSGYDALQTAGAKFECQGGGR